MTRHHNDSAKTSIISSRCLGIKPRQDSQTKKKLLHFRQSSLQDEEQPVEETLKNTLPTLIEPSPFGERVRERWRRSQTGAVPAVEEDLNWTIKGTQQQLEENSRTRSRKGTLRRTSSPEGRVKNVGTGKEKSSHYQLTLKRVN